jgi:hypothetical protein
MQGPHLREIAIMVWGSLIDDPGCLKDHLADDGKFVSGGPEPRPQDRRFRLAAKAAWTVNSWFGDRPNKTGSTG